MKTAVSNSNGAGQNSLREQLRDNTETMHKMASRLGELNLIARKFEAMQAEYEQQLAGTRKTEQAFLTLSTNFKNALEVISKKQDASVQSVANKFAASTHEVKDRLSGLSALITDWEKTLKAFQVEATSNENLTRAELASLKSEMENLKGEFSDLAGRQTECADRVWKLTKDYEQTSAKSNRRQFVTGGVLILLLLSVWSSVRLQTQRVEALQAQIQTLNQQLAKKPEPIQQTIEQKQEDKKSQSKSKR